MARSTQPVADPTRKAAFASGIFYLITFAASIPAALLLAPVLTDPGYIVGPGKDTQILVACLLDLTNALAAIGSAVAVFAVLRRHHESLALGFVTTRLLEAAVQVEVDAEHTRRLDPCAGVTVGIAGRPGARSHIAGRDLQFVVAAPDRRRSPLAWHAGVIMPGRGADRLAARRS